MSLFLYRTIFVGLLVTLVNSNYSGPWDNQENYSGPWDDQDDCNHPEKQLKEKKCFCYTKPENDFEWSICKAACPLYGIDFLGYDFKSLVTKSWEECGNNFLREKLYAEFISVSIVKDY